MTLSRTTWALLLLVSSTGVLRHYYRPVLVLGHSMSPTLHNGQLVLMRCRQEGDPPPKANDVVVFEHDGITHIKRVVSTGGDTLEMVKWRNDVARPLQPGHVDDPTRRLARIRPGLARIFQLHLPQQAMYVLGDNTPASVDSRELGPIPMDELDGEVVFPRVSGDNAPSSTRVARIEARPIRRDP